MGRNMKREHSVKAGVETLCQVDLDALFAQASIRVIAGALLEAEQIYRRIVEEYPEHPRALHALGVIVYRSRQEIATAIDLIKRALDVKPEYPDALTNLGNIYRDQQRKIEAIDC